LLIRLGDLRGIASFFMKDSIRVENITISFGGKLILDRFSLRLKTGEKVILSGASGSGKSSILRGVLGFETPEDGEIYIDGNLLTEDSVWETRRSMAYVPQEPDMGYGIVREVIERPFRYYANRRFERNLKRVPEYFSRFSLSEDLLDMDITKLSGGELQRFQARVFDTIK